MTKRLINEKHRVDPANKAMVLDQWMTPPCAVEALVGLEREYLPPIILEPCCGDGTGFVEPLQKAGYEVIARDIDPDFGFPVADFLTDPLPDGWPYDGAVGIVSNPPFTLAEQFVRKAIEAAPYSAWLLRLNWLEGCRRKRILRRNPTGPHPGLVSAAAISSARLHGAKGGQQCRARILHLGSSGDELPARGQLVRLAGLCRPNEKVSRMT